MNVQMQWEVEQGSTVGYRLGLYSPVDDRRPRLVGPVYSNTPDDQVLMRRVIDRYNAAAAKSSLTLCVAAFPIEGARHVDSRVDSQQG